MQSAWPSTFGPAGVSGQGGPVVYGDYVDEVLAFTATVTNQTSVAYVHANHLYSVAALTDAAGKVVERYAYDAYGSQTVKLTNGNVIGKSGVGYDRGFTGYVADNETGLSYARSRMYSPTLGRFIGRDPIRRNEWYPKCFDGYVDGYNLYNGYFIPNSLDPLGLADCWKISPWKNTTTEGSRSGFTVEFLGSAL